MGDLARLIADGGDGEPFRIHLAILAAVPDFSLPGAFAGNALPHRLIEGFVVPPGFEERRGLSDDLVESVAGDPGESGIDAQDFPVGIGNHHAFLRFKCRSSDADFNLGLFEHGDVLHRADTAARAAVGEELDFPALTDPARCFMDHDAMHVGQGFALECVLPVFIELGPIVRMNAFKVGRAGADDVFVDVDDTAGFRRHLNPVG